MTKKEIIIELKSIKTYLTKPINDTCEDCRLTAEQTEFEINRLISDIKKGISR